VHFYRVGGPAGSVPRQLPADVRGFVNRDDELERLDRAFAGEAGEPPTIGVSVIAGTAGVGKTSLALRWAHRVRKRFPDGQLYVNLRGYDPGPPVTPEQVLDRFLRALNVPSGAIPGELEAMAALYRSLLADRRMLLVLDNAATVGQVRPLLPGTNGCLAVVTSRSRLSGLSVRDGADRLTLDVLSESEALTLVRSVTTGYRTPDDPGELVELARLCARLPLALRIAAERAVSRPKMHLGELIRDLRDESALWDALTVGDDEEADAVRTVFAWSYRALPEDAAHMFRLLGLHPGPEIGAAAAAALTGENVGRARQLLDVLVGMHLLEQPAPDRYQFHDLMRAYATDQAHRGETPERQQDFLRRVLTWYLHTADAAQAVISPEERRVPLDQPDQDITPLTFHRRAEAMRWYEVERANLVDATRAAANAGLYRVAWQLPVVLRSIYMDLNPFGDWLATGHIGLAAAREVGDRWGEAELLESLGMAYTQSQRPAQGAEFHRAALAIRRETGDRFGEALSLNSLGLLCLRLRKLDEAHSYFAESIAVFEEVDDAFWVALALGNLGETCFELGRLGEAADLLRQALQTSRDRGDRGMEGNALRVLSMVQREEGDPAAALVSIERAVAIAVDDGNRMWEGYWLLELGRVREAIGEPAEALVSYQRSAVLHRQLGDRSREAAAWDGAGHAYRELGRLDEAVEFHRRAIATHRELGDGWQAAVSLTNLAAALQLTGAADDARDHYREALSLLVEFDDPKAARLRADVDDILHRS
jgi:tetratricopeptide (TPR) repeat protein